MGLPCLVARRSDPMKPTPTPAAPARARLLALGLVPLLCLLAFAAPAQATDPECLATGIHTVDNACGTAVAAYHAGTAPVICLDHTPPDSWTSCTPTGLPRIPLLDDVYCYLYSPPVTWFSCL